MAGFQKNRQAIERFKGKENDLGKFRIGFSAYQDRRKNCPRNIRIVWTKTAWDMNKLFRARVFISGTVQGVSLRWWIQREAAKYDIKGWVKNLPDGRVEALLEGEKENIERIIVWMKRGADFAKIDKIEVQWEEYEGEFEEFEIKY